MRDALVESATKFYLESRPRNALEQFKEGLECLGLLPYMNRHSSLFREVSSTLRSLFCPKTAYLFKAERSPPGTNQRAIESRVICFWRDWPLEVEGGNAHPLTLEKVNFHFGGFSIPRLGLPVEKRLQSSLLPHGKRYWSAKSRSKRLLNSFYPQAIRLLNI